MDRESSELIELGSVSADTAGGEDVGIETNGKFRPLGLSQDWPALRDRRKPVARRNLLARRTDRRAAPKTNQL